MNMTAQTTRKQRRIARQAAGLHPNDSCPVQVVSGWQSPHEAGESYYWTTPSGKTRVHYPSAYGWPTLYWPSTRHVEVGAEWLAENAGYEPDTITLPASDRQLAMAGC